jgi:spermidine/putrescine transport system ATP-binding protein
MRSGKIEQVGTPSEIYEYPKTAFVADFIGDTNLFEGRVEAADSSTLQMTTKTGLQIVVQHKVSRETISQSKDVRVSVRPEKIRLSLSPPESKINCFEGRLQHVMYMGTHIHYVVELLSGDRLTVMLPNVTNKLPDPNTPVYARWAATDCLALEE